MTTVIINDEDRDIDQELTDYRIKYDHYVDSDIVAELHTWLGEDGCSFFQECWDTHGTVSPTLTLSPGMPYSVHMVEGMQVRNFLRTLPLTDLWDDGQLFDNLWEVAVQRAIGVSVGQNQLQLKVEI